MKIRIKSAAEIEFSCVQKNGSLVDKTDSSIVFSPDMRKYCGETTEIQQKTDEGFILKIDAGLNLWLAHWIEEVE